MNLADHPRGYRFGPICVWLASWYWSVRFGRRLSIVLYPHGNPQIAPKSRRASRGARAAANVRKGAETRVGL